MASSVAWTRRETSCLSCTLACSEMEDDVERAALVFFSCHHFVLICLVFFTASLFASRRLRHAFCFFVYLSFLP